VRPAVIAADNLDEQGQEDFGFGDKFGGELLQEEEDDTGGAEGQGKYETIR
jgi:hypothetical protein